MKKIRLDSKVGIYLRDDDFSSNFGIFNLHPSKGTHWVCYIKDCYIDSDGCSSPKKILENLKNKHRKCLYSEYQNQKNDSYCASHCLYIIHLTKVLAIDFKSVVFSLYSRKFS